MTEEISKFNSADVKRRSLIKGAAWSVPVIAVAATAPLAAASVNSADAYWTAENTQLLELGLLTGGTVAGVALLPTAPTAFAIDNTPGIIPNVTVTFTVAQQGSISLGLGVGSRYLRGFAPSVIPNGTQLGQTVISERQIGGLGIGLVAVYAQDTVSEFSLGDVAADQITNYNPIYWSATDRRTVGLTLAEVSVFSSFGVTAEFKSNGTTFKTINSTINILADAGVL